MTDPFNPKSFPLHDSARDSKNLLVKELSSSQPSAILAKDGDGRTPLFWAASSGNTEGLSILLKSIKNSSSLERKFDVDDADNGGWTLLHIASSTGNEDIIDLLSSWNPDANAQTNAGQTPLHFAVSKGHIDVVRKLLNSPFKASSRIKDARGQIPLHRAASVGSLPILDLLIQAKSPLNTTDQTGWTPLHHAMAEGHGDIAVALIKAGADLDRADNEGHTPVQVALDEKTKHFIESELKDKR